MLNKQSHSMLFDARWHPILSFVYSLNIASSNCILYDIWSIFFPVMCLDKNIEISSMHLSGHSEMLYFWLHLLNHYLQEPIPAVLNNYSLLSRENFDITYYCICHFIVTKNTTITQFIHNLYKSIIYQTEWSCVLYKGGLKSFRPSLHETRDKRPLGRKSERSWCHRHTNKSMIKLFWPQPMAPWALTAAYQQGEKFST